MAFQKHRDIFRAFYNEFIPILIEGNLFALDKSCTIKNKEIFDAVTKGTPIQTTLMFHQEINRIKPQDGNSKNDMIVDITKI